MVVRGACILELAISMETVLTFGLKATNSMYLYIKNRA